MPLHKRSPFIPKPIPDDLKPDELVFYCKLTNEIFRDYDDYFERVILCNSLVWACSVTGKINLTFEEALESEKQAQKTVLSVSPFLKKGLLFLVNQTYRGKVTDVVEDIFSYSREHYFVGETVLGVIGNLWCHSRVVRVIQPTPQEVEQYRKEQEAKGELQNNDYLSDDTWGPPPDLFRYEVQEMEPDDPDLHDVHILEAIDVKREKLSLTKDKCRYLIKSSTVYDEEERAWRVRRDIWESLRLGQVAFEGGLFTGRMPLFEKSLGPPRKVKSRISSQTKTTPNSSAPNSAPGKPIVPRKSLNGITPTSTKPQTVKRKRRKAGDSKKVEVPKLPSPEEEKQREFERKAKERETQKEEKKLAIDFKKLWMKPKEDLEVEDLQELPVGDPVDCKIPNELFGDFLMVLEFLSSYSTLLRVRDSFPQGVSFEILERALHKTEVAGPLSDILQLLVRAIFRLQESEDADITQEEKAAVELSLEERAEDVSIVEAVEQATAAATWSLMYQGTPLYRMTLDHLSLNEILRLHLLCSGARPSEKDMKWRLQMRGGYSHKEDPGLEFRLEEPQVLKTLGQGTVFDLSVREKLKLLQCLINQVLTYPDVRDSIDQTFDQFKETRMELRALQAAERRHENEDNAWRAKLKHDRMVPGENFMKNSSPAALPEKGRLLNEEEVEGFLNKRQRETLRRKEQFEYKVGDLSESLQKQEKRLGLHPLGSDRAYRRYWIFSSLPGLFVEDDDENLGPCFPQPTPHIPNIDIQDITFIKKHFKRLLDAEKSSSSPRPLPPPSKKTPKPASVIASEIQQQLQMGTCTGGQGECPVHSSTSTKTKWSFFYTEEQLDQLIAKLSPRGVREKELRQVLMDEAAGIRELLRKCPAGKLNLTNTYPEPVEKKSRAPGKNCIDPNLTYPPKTPIPTILELQLRDLILEAEEKICLGTLGSLKVKDRGAWVKAIENRSYDRQVTELRWGHEKSLSTGEDQGQGNSSPREGMVKEEIAIRDLASAILQLEQSVEPKFLQRPLRTSEKEEGEKKKKGDGMTHLRANWVVGTTLERWETSLMKSTSFSQLFIHFFTLDKSVTWNRSVLNARCRICRRKGDAENMLLCDGCNKGHHAYCFKPPLDQVPKGDWFCSDCKPPPLPQPAARKGRKVNNSDDEESEEESEGDDEMPVLEEETLVESCIVCGSGGEVICCDGCPGLYHLHCLDPPKQRVPRGQWYCDSCKEGREKNSNQNRRKGSSKRSSGTEEEEEEDDEEESEVGRVETDSDEEEEESVPVKVRITKTPRKLRSPTPSPSESETEDEPVGRGMKRKSAYKAGLRISEVAKRLRRSDSKENESSEASSSESTGGVRKGSIDSSDSSVTGRTRNRPKRTRLQRMNTNRCGDSGDLDNVLLDKLIMDLMRHPDAWPFLKPVTRSDAPDYHDIVKSPMDLGTIKYKLNSMVYTCNQEFLGDLHLVFDNCFKYNDPDAQVFKAGEFLQIYCERRCEKAGLHFGDSN